MRPHTRYTRQNRGFTLIELLIVMAIIAMLSAIVIPYMSKQLMQANETAAIAEIGSIRQAELQYWSQFGHYAASLAQLGPPTNGSAGPATAGLIPKSLADGVMSGYIFTVAGTPAGYTVNANPQRFGSSGGRTFYSDETGVTRNNSSQEPATVDSPAIGTAVPADSASAK